jgi:hypothetical protein
MDSRQFSVNPERSKRERRRDKGGRDDKGGGRDNKGGRTYIQSKADTKSGRNDNKREGQGWRREDNIPAQASASMDSKKVLLIPPQASVLRSATSSYVNPTMASSESFGSQYPVILLTIVFVKLPT